MELILHFSVHCANISFFLETTKFLGEFLLLALISEDLMQGKYDGIVAVSSMLLVFDSFSI